MYTAYFFGIAMFTLSGMLGVGVFWACRICKALRVHHADMVHWQHRLDEVEMLLERAKRDNGTILDKIEDLAAQQLQDWNSIQGSFAVIDGRLGQVERRFGPLAPLEQKVDEAPEAEPDAPVPVEQEPADGR